MINKLNELEKINFRTSIENVHKVFDGDDIFKKRRLLLSFASEKDIIEMSKIKGFKEAEAQELIKKMNLEKSKLVLELQKLEIKSKDFDDNLLLEANIMKQVLIDFFGIKYEELNEIEKYRYLTSIDYLTEVHKNVKNYVKKQQKKCRLEKLLKSELDTFTIQDETMIEEFLKSKLSIEEYIIKTNSNISIESFIRKTLTYQFITNNDIYKDLSLTKDIRNSLSLNSYIGNLKEESNYSQFECMYHEKEINDYLEKLKNDEKNAESLYQYCILDKDFDHDFFCLDDSHKEEPKPTSRPIHKKEITRYISKFHSSKIKEIKQEKRNKENYKNYVEGRNMLMNFIITNGDLTDYLEKNGITKELFYNTLNIAKDKEYDLYKEIFDKMDSYDKDIIEEMIKINQIYEDLYFNEETREYFKENKLFKEKMFYELSLIQTVPFLDVQEYIRLNNAHKTQCSIEYKDLFKKTLYKVNKIRSDIEMRPARKDYTLKNINGDELSVNDELLNKISLILKDAGISFVFEDKELICEAAVKWYFRGELQEFINIIKTPIKENIKRNVK